MEEASSSDPRRCKQSAVINKSRYHFRAPLTGASYLPGRCGHQPQFTAAAISFALASDCLFILSLFTCSFSVLLNVSARAVPLAGAPEISSCLPHVYCAFFPPTHAAGDAIRLFFAPIWRRKLIYASMCRRGRERRFQEEFIPGLMRPPCSRKSNSP